jgi:hypothetical protein
MCSRMSWYDAPDIALLELLLDSEDALREWLFEADIVIDRIGLWPGVVGGPSIRDDESVALGVGDFNLVVSGLAVLCGPGC